MTQSKWLCISLLFEDLKSSRSIATIIKCHWTENTFGTSTLYPFKNWTFRAVPFNCFERCTENKIQMLVFLMLTDWFCVNKGMPHGCNLASHQLLRYRLDKPWACCTTLTDHGNWIACQYELKTDVFSHLASSNI